MKNKPDVVIEIEKVFGGDFKLNLPKNQLDPIRGVMGAQKDYPKYAVNEKGELIGLNLAMTKLTNKQWEEISELLEKNNIELLALDLNENNITKFELKGNLSQLEILDIDDNFIETIPEEIKVNGKAAVLRFLKDIFKQGASELFEVKMLIVGEGETGKTTLWNLLQDPSYPVPNPKQKSTIGIQIKEGWSFQHIERSQDEFQVNLWDFAGQDIQYMTHQFFLTRRSFYVLLADGRRQVANFSYWLRIIDLLGCDPTSNDPLPVLVVLNEKGNPISKMPYDPQTAKTDYPKLNIIRREVDFAIKDDGRMEALTKNIQQILCKQIEHLPLTIPAYWNAVRQELYEKRKTNNHIDVDTFEEICQDKGIQDQQQLSDLSELLHDLGVILHFKDDPALEDFIVLNPQWAVNAVYEIMKHEEVKTKNQGRFDKDLLRKVWKGKGYNANERSKLLNLMLKDNLEVCFSAKEKGKTIYIAPQLLPETKPEDLDWESIPQNLQYIYHYPFMPKGIIGRLIVRLNELIDSKADKKVVWEKGMIIKIDDTRALVQEVEDKRQGRQLIKIEVKGATLENKKYVLRRVQEQLEQIHRRSFPSLKVFQKVPCNCTECSESVNPFEHDLEALKKNQAKNGAMAVAQCGISFEQIPVQQLFDGVFQKGNIMEFSRSHSLKDVLPEDTALVIKRLEEKISEDSENYNEFLLLKTRWNENEQFYNEGTVDPKDWALERRRIQKSLLGFISDLE